MIKDLEKADLPGGRIPPHGLSLEEIFQYLKDRPGEYSHQAKMKEREFHELFIDFFIDYFYMKDNIDLKEFISSLERAILVKMLNKFNGNQKDTAAFLGINHTTLNQKVRKHKICFFKKPIEG
jgi:DNA-binding protein Fis